MSDVEVVLAVLVLAAVLVRVVMWRLAWLDHRTITPRMKRGEPSRLWWLAPLVPMVVTGLWWAGYVDAARWAVAVAAGLPFLFLTEKTWSA